MQGRRPVRGGRRRRREATGERREAGGGAATAAAETGTAPPSLDAVEGPPPRLGSSAGRRAEDPILGPPKLDLR